MALTFPSGVTLDSATLSQWLTALQGCTSQEYVAHVLLFRRRFGLAVAPSANLQGDIGVGTRNEWAELIRSGKAFTMGSTAAASVGNLSLYQIFNPNNAGAQVALLGAWVSISVTGEIRWGFDTAATGFSDGNCIPTRLSDFSQVAGRITVLKVAQAAAAPGTFTQMGRIHLLANTPFFLGAYSDAWLTEVPPNNGFDIVTVSANVGLAVNFLYAELPVGYQT